MALKSVRLPFDAYIHFTLQGLPSQLIDMPWLNRALDRKTVQEWILHVEIGIFTELVGWYSVCVSQMVSALILPPMLYTSMNTLRTRKSSCVNARGIPPARGRKMLTPPPCQLDLTPPPRWLDLTLTPLPPGWTWPPRRLDLTPPTSWTWPPPTSWTWPPPSAGPDPPHRLDLTPPPPAGPDPPPPPAGPDPPPQSAGPDPPPPQVWTDKQSETITFPSYYVRGR